MGRIWYMTAPARMQQNPAVIWRCSRFAAIFATVRRSPMVHGSCILLVYASCNTVTHAVGIRLTIAMVLLEPHAQVRGTTSDTDAAVEDSGNQAGGRKLKLSSLIEQFETGKTGL